MSYKSVETALLTVLRLLANYDGDNSSAGDYRILGKGVTSAIILQPGAIPQREVVAYPRRVRTLWVVDVELLIPFLGEISTTAEALRDDRQEIIDQIDKYPTLSGATGVVVAFITSAPVPDLWLGESRRWWRQVLHCQIEERVTVTVAE